MGKVKQRLLKASFQVGDRVVVKPRDQAGRWGGTEGTVDDIRGEYTPVYRVSFDHLPTAEFTEIELRGTGG
jgi:small-conductance mechanosensitive channel